MEQLNLLIHFCTISKVGAMLIFTVYVLGYIT